MVSLSQTFPTNNRLIFFNGKNSGAPTKNSLGNLNNVVIVADQERVHISSNKKEFYKS